MALLHTAEIRINRRCNEACLFCNSARAMDNFLEGPEAVLAGIDRSRDEGATQITLTGREPTLDPELPRYVRYASELGFRRIIVQSNGVLLVDRERCRELARAGVDAVTLSLHALDPKISELLTQNPDDAEQTLRALDNIVAVGVEAEVNFVITRLNLREGVKVVDLLADRREAQPDATIRMLLSFIAPTFQGSEKLKRLLIPTYAQAVPWMQRAIDRARARELSLTLPLRCCVPFCVLGEGLHHAPEEPPAGGVPTPSSHLKLPECVDCPHRGVCEGVWREYVELHGVEEIRRAAGKLVDYRPTKE